MNRSHLCTADLNDGVWAGASEVWVTALCNFLHHTFCCAGPICLPVCKRVPDHFLSPPQRRNIRLPAGKSLACADTHDEFCLHVSSMFFWVKSMSLYIDIKMMRPLKSRGCTLLASFIVVWTTCSSCIVACPGFFPLQHRPALQRYHEVHDVPQMRRNLPFPNFPLCWMKLTFSGKTWNSIREDRQFCLQLFVDTLIQQSTRLSWTFRPIQLVLYTMQNITTHRVLRRKST